MPMILGSKMSAELQKQALVQYVHRFTGNHRPAWANDKRLNCAPSWPQFSDDADWLACTFFPVSADGARILNAPCESHPSWPYGPNGERAQPAKD